VITLASLFSGLATGFPLFYRLIYIISLTTILNYLWTWNSIKQINIVEIPNKTVSEVGGNFRQQLILSNSTLLPKAGIEISTQSNLPDYPHSPKKFVATNLNGLENYQVTISLPTKTRGVFLVGPSEVSVSDPFGIFKMKKIIGSSKKLLVYPKIHDLSGFDVNISKFEGDYKINKQALAITPQVGSIRKYSPGDSINRIHWKTTAKIGTLMSKEFEIGKANNLWLILDFEQQAQSGFETESTDEYIVSIGASITNQFIKSKIPVGLIAYGDKKISISPEVTKNHMNLIMLRLIETKAEGITPISTILEIEPHIVNTNNSIVIITTNIHSDLSKKIDFLIKKRLSVTLIVVDKGSFANKQSDPSQKNFITKSKMFTITKGSNISETLKPPYKFSTQN
jgi:uncharacterized protein (DUF58 family)